MCPHTAPSHLFPDSSNLKKLGCAVALIKPRVNIAWGQTRDNLACQNCQSLCLHLLPRIPNTPLNISILLFLCWQCSLWWFEDLFNRICQSHTYCIQNAIQERKLQCVEVDGVFIQVYVCSVTAWEGEQCLPQKPLSNWDSQCPSHTHRSSTAM